MEKSMGYRLMQGKNGITGYVRRDHTGEQLVIRGLDAGMKCDLYIMEENGAQQSMSLHADGMGQLTYRAARPFWYFAAAQGRVILWEKDGRQDENYLQACALLLKNVSEGKEIEEEIRKAAAEEKMDEPAAPVEMPCQLTPPIPENTAYTEEEVPPYFLRARGEGEAADALPSLLWPEAVKDLQVYFVSLPPIAPFDLPGWRFVKVSSPVMGCAYCALGYTAVNARVAKIAYALPGIPFQPPANLTGYRYYPGRDGQGYWVTVQDAEK